jgi:site-specific recombinase XerD
MGEAHGRSGHGRDSGSGGYALANAGHDTRALQAWLGHKNIQHTVRYTELAPDRFKDFWK